ncbi:MAG: hypothetical protein ACPGNV_17630 [Mangrovicoccus sp.]
MAQSNIILQDDPVDDWRGAVSAAEIRNLMAAREQDKYNRKRLAQERKRLSDRAFRYEFMTHHFDTQDVIEIARRIKIAASHGAYEVEMIRFPAELCTDKGRAINNSLPDWPDTLQGEARQIYEFWRKDAKPLGFGLSAIILDYPAGLLGDVGMFLTWSDPSGPKD